jgi:hypothetical protein
MMANSASQPAGGSGAGQQANRAQPRHVPAEQHLATRLAMLTRSMQQRHD